MSIGPVWRAGSVLSTTKGDETMGSDRYMEEQRGGKGSSRYAAEQKAAAQQEKLRELLSYCRTEAETLDLDNLSDEFNPYDDIAYRLTEILDGEK